MCQAPFQAFYRINPFKLHSNYIKQMLKFILVMIYRYTYIYTYIYIGILLSHRKEQNNTICSNMDGPKDCYAE